MAQRRVARLGSRPAHSRQSSIRYAADPRFHDTDGCVRCSLQLASVHCQRAVQTRIFSSHRGITDPPPAFRVCFSSRVTTGGSFRAKTSSHRWSVSYTLSPENRCRQVMPVSPLSVLTGLLMLRLFQARAGLSSAALLPRHLTPASSSRRAAALVHPSRLFRCASSVCRIRKILSVDDPYSPTRTGQVLECGLDGVLLRTEDPQEVIALSQYLVRLGVQTDGEYFLHWSNASHCLFAIQRDDGA